MSIKACSIVWDQSKNKGSTLLLLLAIADYANDEGVAYPSLDTLANKTRMTQRNVINLIDKAKLSGELKVETSASRYKTNLYSLIFDGFPPSEKISDEKIAGAPNIQGNDNIDGPHIGVPPSEVHEKSVFVFSENPSLRMMIPYLKSYLIKDSSSFIEESSEKFVELISVMLRSILVNQLIIDDDMSLDRAYHFASIIDVASQGYRLGKIASPNGWVSKVIINDLSFPHWYFNPTQRCPQCDLPWGEEATNCQAHTRMKYRTSDE